MTFPKYLQFLIHELNKNKSKITKVFFTIFISFVIFSSVTILKNGIENEIKNNLINQLCETVRWRETLDFLDKSKVLSITDSGPGKTIIGMARKFKEMEKLALIDP